MTRQQSSLLETDAGRGETQPQTNPNEIAQDERGGAVPLFYKTGLYCMMRDNRRQRCRVTETFLDELSLLPCDTFDRYFSPDVAYIPLIVSC